MLDGFLFLQPRATLKFPLGEISLQEKEDEEEEKQKRTLSVNGILKRQVMNGVCTALYTDEELRLRYAYKVPDFYQIHSLLFLCVTIQQLIEGCTCKRISYPLPSFGSDVKTLFVFIQDDALSFIPSISLPSNAASFAFKRRFSPSDKLRLVASVCLLFPSYSGSTISSATISFI